MVIEVPGRPPGEAASSIASGRMLNTLFLIGWSVADEQHLSVLPEALVQGLQVSYAALRISRTDGAVLHEHAFPEDPASAELAAQFEPHASIFTRNLGEQLTLELRICTGMLPLSDDQLATFLLAAELIHAALIALFVKQHDRGQLGAPYTQFSDREWIVCERLDGPEGEKAISESMAASRHTVHCHVKNIYRKLKVQSRLEVIDHLDRTRGDARRRSMHAVPFALEHYPEKDAGETHDVPTPA